MVKYILFNIFSFICLIWQMMILKIYALNISYNPRHFDFIPPLLLAYAAGLFLIQKTKRAGLVSLIGLSIVSRPVLINWLSIVMCSKENMNLLIGLLIVSTLFLFFLGFLSIKAILQPDNKILELNYYPKRFVGIVLGAIPLIALMIYIAIQLWPKNTEYLEHLS